MRIRIKSWFKKNMIPAFVWDWEVQESVLEGLLCLRHEDEYGIKT